MRIVWRILGAVIALLVGGFCGFLLAKHEIGANSLTVADGPWHTNPAIGSNSANPFTRAGIAVTGLLALPHKEAVYYNASTDEAGHPLQAGREYVIRGRSLPGRWWSITVYGADKYLISNQAHAYSVKSSEVKRRPDGSFVAYISRRPRGENWLAAGSKKQSISLTLRIYDPPADLFKRLGRVALPTIRRVKAAKR